MLGIPFHRLPFINTRALNHYRADAGKYRPFRRVPVPYDRLSLILSEQSGVLLEVVCDFGLQGR
jgi:hypothetical protein